MKKKPHLILWWMHLSKPTQGCLTFLSLSVSIMAKPQEDLLELEYPGPEFLRIE